MIQSNKISFGPNSEELVGRLRSDLRMGVPILLGDDQPLLAASIETLSQSRFAALLALPGKKYLAITDWRAEALKLGNYDSGIVRINVDENATLDLLQAIADPSRDLENPLKGPFSVLRGTGDPAGATLAIALCKSRQLLPAALCVEISDRNVLSNNHNLSQLSVDKGYDAISRENLMAHSASARLPIRVSDNALLHVFRPEDGGEEHYAIEIGQPRRDEPVLARLHSACFTGDVIGSLKCDCGAQLNAALELMGGADSGVLLYLNQEGRGIGLANKMRAYHLQNQGFDTVIANHRLGFEDDERDFRIGATILRALGFKSVRLLTNNPGKIARMQAHGIEVAERIPLIVGRTKENTDYLATKAKKSGHLL